MDRKQAYKICDEIHGKSTQKVEDCAGRTINKGACRDLKHKYRWNIDHIKPRSKGGKDNLSNLQIVHILTNQEKYDNYPNFKTY